MFSKTIDHPEVDINSKNLQDPTKLIFPQAKDLTDILPFDNIYDLEFISEEISDLNNKLKSPKDTFNHLTIIQKAVDLTTKNLKQNQIAQKTLQFCNEIIPFNCSNILVNKNNNWKAIQRKTAKIFENCFKMLSKDGFIDWMFDKQTYVVIPINELKFSHILMDTGKVLCFPMMLESNRVGVCMLFLGNDRLSFSLADLEAVKIIVNQVSTSMKFSEVQNRYIQSEKKIQNLKELLAHFVKMAIVGELAKGITHEINNPLQVILGKIQIAMMGTNNQELLKSVEKQSLQIALLVRLIASISKGQSRDSADTIEINSFIRSTVSLIQNQIEKKGIKINFCFENKELKICSNSSYLQQVILNSVLNAKKRLSQGGELHISTGMVEKDLIKIEFRDTAPKSEVIFNNKNYKDISKLKKVSNPDLLFGEIINKVLIEEMGGEISYLSKNALGNVITYKIPQKL